MRKQNKFAVQQERRLTEQSLLTETQRQYGGIKEQIIYDKQAIKQMKKSGQTRGNISKA